MARLYAPVVNAAKQSIPHPPTHLSQLELNCWNEIVPMIANTNVLNTADTEAIAVYCNAKATFLKAKQHIDTMGVIIQSKQGYIKNPATTVINESVKTMTNFFANFGMTPSARAALKQSDPNTANDALTILLQANPLLRDVETRNE